MVSNTYSPLGVYTYTLLITKYLRIFRQTVIPTTIIILFPFVVLFQIFFRYTKRS